MFASLFQFVRLKKSVSICQPVPRFVKLFTADGASLKKDLQEEAGVACLPWNCLLLPDFN